MMVDFTVMTECGMLTILIYSLYHAMCMCKWHINPPVQTADADPIISLYLYWPSDMDFDRIWPIINKIKIVYLKDLTFLSIWRLHQRN